MDVSLSSTPSRVVFVVDNLLRPNGIVSSVVMLARAFEAEEIPTEIWAFGPVEEELRRGLAVFDAMPGSRYTSRMRSFETSKAALKPVRRAATVGWWPWAARRMRERAATWPLDTLVIGAGLDAVHAMWQAGVRPDHLVSQVHSTSTALKGEQRRNVFGANRVSQAITALTRKDAEDLRTWGVRAVAIPNPVEVSAPTFRMSGGRDSSASPGRRVVFLGRLAPEKQVDHLIRAFASVARPDWELCIYGDGPERPALEKMAASCGARVLFCGVTDDVHAALAQADLHVLTSRFEGLPMSILEAGAQRVPTVAYDCAPGVGEAIGQGGFLVPPDDEEAMAHAIEAVLTDDAARAELSAHAFYRAQQFAPRAIAEQWFGLWRALVVGRLRLPLEPESFDRTGSHSLEPKVSVIIPAHNAADTLGAQLDALARQEGAPTFEVIVVDNRSDDDLCAVASAFRDALDLRLVRAFRRAGAAYARNAGACVARGSVLLFCDADDEVFCDWVGRAYDATRGGTVIATGPLQSWLGTDSDRQAACSPERAQVGAIDSGYLRAAPGSNLAISRESYLSVGGMDSRFPMGAEDVDLVWRVQEGGMDLVVAEDMKVLYRTRPTKVAKLRQHYSWGRGRAFLYRSAALRGHSLADGRLTAPAIQLVSRLWHGGWKRSKLALAIDIVDALAKTIGWFEARSSLRAEWPVADEVHGVAREEAGTRCSV